jgi:hypothetical protein
MRPSNLGEFIIQHPKLFAGVVYTAVAGLGLGMALLSGMAWWMGILIAFGAMIIVGNLPDA